MKQTRLHSLSQELGEAVGSASSDRQRSAAIAACKFALEHAGVTHPEVIKAMDMIRDGISAPHSLREQIESLAAKADDAYLEISSASAEDGSQRGSSLRLFSQARALSAVAFALGPNPETAALESIYEAAAVTDEPQHFFRYIAATLVEP